MFPIDLLKQSDSLKSIRKIGNFSTDLCLPLAHILNRNGMSTPNKLFIEKNVYSRRIKKELWCNQWRLNMSKKEEISAKNPNMMIPNTLLNTVTVNIRILLLAHKDPKITIEFFQRVNIKMVKPLNNAFQWRVFRQNNSNC